MSAKFSPLQMIKQQQEENKYRTQVLDLREVVEHPKNDFPITKEDIKKLADSILKSGGVLQFPLVRMFGDGSYQMLAGHRRRRASILLGETIDEKYFRTMCYVLEGISDERAELYLIETNIQARELTPKLRAEKVVETRRLVEVLRDRGELEVKSIKREVAKRTSLSESTVILQTRIANQLDKDLLELYDQGKFTMREAYDYSGLSEESQEQILHAYLEDPGKDELQKEISRIMLLDKIGVGKKSPLEVDANKKIKQAHKRILDIGRLKEDGASIDYEALRDLKRLIDELLKG